MRVTDKYVFFFTDKDVFSNWYVAPFYDKMASKFNHVTECGIMFNCVEQYMMWRKASLFKDYATASAILSGSRKRTNEKDQAYYKRMGREVKGYEDSMWQDCREMVIKRGLFMKYHQNKELKSMLMKYKSKIFVEASPYDAIYGIKMGMYDQGVEDPGNWKGENLLGKWHNDLINSFSSKDI